MRGARVPSAVTLAVAVAAVVAASALATPGALDGTLAHRGMVAEPYGGSAFAVAAAVQRNGRIVTVGESETSKQDQLISARFMPNGRLDRSYGNGGWVALDLGGTGGGTSLVILRNGEILIGGAGRSARNQPLSFAAVKLQPNGQLDQSFGHNGVATVPIGVGAIANAIAVQKDGKIVLGGIADASYDRFAVARLNANGTIDRSFGSNGVTMFGEDGAAWGMGIRPDGSIVLAGEYSPNGGGLLDVLSGLGLGAVGRRLSSGAEYMAAALLPNGHADPSFGNDGVVLLPIGQEALCTAIALQRDGKVILAGSAFTHTGVAATVRLMQNGSLDDSFGVNGISEQPLYNPVNAVTLQKDGKVLVAATGPVLIRLDTTGVPDPTFAQDGIDTIGAGGEGNAANGVTVDSRTGNIVLSGTQMIAGQAELSVFRLRGN